MEILKIYYFFYYFLGRARELLSKEKDFYVLVYNVLEKYDYSGAIIEYCFKMILNMMQDRIFQKFFLKKFIFFLCFLQLCASKTFLSQNLYSNFCFCGFCTNLMKLTRIC